MEIFENFTDMWEEKGEMLKEIGCSERAAHAIWYWGVNSGRADERASNYLNKINKK